jgi:hypothetical protein
MLTTKSDPGQDWNGALHYALLCVSTTGFCICIHVLLFGLGWLDWAGFVGHAYWI